LEEEVNGLGLKLIGVLLAFLVVPVITIMAAAYRGWALAILWAWFVVPIFRLPILTGPQAVGLSIFLGLVMQGNPSTEVPLGKQLAALILGPLIALAIGWIIKAYFGL
jgi:hypothetical protein